MTKLFARIFLAAMMFAGAVYGAPNAEPYPQPASKKGLQVQMLDDALALGIKHAAFNCNLAGLVDLDAKPGSVKFPVDGHDYFFRADRVADLDHQIQELSSKGIVVSLILLNLENHNPALDAIFLHPDYDSKGAPNHMSAFNALTPDGQRYLRAASEFLAQRYSEPGAPHGRVWNYIVGNEVQSHWFWNNQGRSSVERVATDYERAVRTIRDAVRRYSANARIFLSFDHHWNIRYAAGAPDQTCAGREFVEAFDRAAKAHGNLDWNIAFHPYPENLMECRFWQDKTATTADSTPRITLKNLEVLTRYIRRPEMLNLGRQRRIILSEQGFNCADRADGERDQAAAWCAAWVKVSRLDGIDAFILHRHVDHRDEGLNLGLWTRKADSVVTPDRHRQIYDVFRLADTPAWKDAFAFALPVVGAESWERFAPPVR